MSHFINRFDWTLFVKPKSHRITDTCSKFSIYRALIIFCMMLTLPQLSWMQWNASLVMFQLLWFLKNWEIAVFYEQGLPICLVPDGHRLVVSKLSWHCCFSCVPNLDDLLVWSFTIWVILNGCDKVTWILWTNTSSLFSVPLKNEKLKVICIIERQKLIPCLYFYSFKYLFF